MNRPLRRVVRRVTTLLLMTLIGFSLGAVGSARASADRSAPATTLQAILGAIESLASGLRPASNGQTRLLFPAVSTTGTNFTELFITNAGQDPSGTPGQSGDCTVELFGTGAHSVPFPVPVPVGSLGSVGINAGNTNEFQGYAVATCDFPFAHGLYFLTLDGQPFTGHALVLPPVRSAAVVESLGQ